ncbi:MAG: M28 family peptidase [Promethearchaeota archaeon]|nr:MAG: M28 family peptidase [Candidatus Lokiarchaeota archaeon]
MQNKFDSHQLVKKLSFPRLPGTEGEKEAQRIIESELKTLNIHNYKKESFVYTKFFMNILLRIYSFLIGIQMIFLIILLYFQLYYLVIPFAVILLITSFFSREIRENIQFKFTRIGKKKKSENYIIELPAKQKTKDSNQNIVILAHYDSISMSFHPLFDGAIFFFSLIGGTLFSVHVILVMSLYFLNLISIEIIQFIYGLFLAGFYGIQIFNKRHNKSFGTADNATAVANAFYNMEFFSKNPLNNTNLVFVLTGAEEMGDYGADAFIKKHNNELNRHNTYFFVPDTVGANQKTNLYAFAQGLPKKEFSPIITKHIEDLLNSSNINYKIKPLYIPPLIHFSTDHAPLKPFGYQFIIFLSNAPIHSKRDNIDNYYPEMLDDFNSFSRDLIIHMDKNYQNLAE